jgi:hypothetical protein
MKTKILILLITLTCSSMFSCKKEGCMDKKAVNYDPAAKKDNGMCSYSYATFFANKGEYSNYDIFGNLIFDDISSIDVSVNGKHIGSISKYYPSGVPDCDSNPGTVLYTFESGDKVDWNATIIFSRSNPKSLSGQASRCSNNAGNCNCIKINVTP